MNEKLRKTLIILKPDCVSRGLVGEVLSRFERRGFFFLDMKLMSLDSQVLEEHYFEHKDKPFFGDLCEYMMSGSVIVGVLTLDDPEVDIVSTVRKMVGITDCSEALSGTIRGDYGLSRRANLIHASDSYLSAEREIKLFF